MKKYLTYMLLGGLLVFTGCGSKTADNGMPVSNIADEVVAESSSEDDVTAEAHISMKESEESLLEVTAEPSVEESLTEEELASLEWAAYEEYMASLAYPSKKAEYVDYIVEAIELLPDEKPESTLKQKDVECDTLQWLNATYAMFVRSLGADYHYVGGYNDERDDKVEYLYEQLESSWGIVDRASAIETILWLATDGHAPGYAEEIQLLDMGEILELDEETFLQVWDFLAQEQGLSEEDKQSVVEYYQHMRVVYNACGDNGIDGWDYCRIMQLCGNCYYLGYFTLEESLSIQLAVAQVMQAQFDSWTALNDSYYYGYSYYAYGSSYVELRKWHYDRLMEDGESPYNTLDFKMPLEKFW